MIKLIFTEMYLGLLIGGCRIFGSIEIPLPVVVWAGASSLSESFLRSLWAQGCWMCRVVVAVGHSCLSWKVMLRLPEVIAQAVAKAMGPAGRAMPLRLAARV